ncbi:MAG: hypothetical protein U9R79_22885, partial [Armatimonadota bacterium]|nr:hypothetical protein [Armatimonadota bacterium]
MSVMVAFGNRLRKAGAQLSFGFEEAKHPRYPRGHPQGGQLMPTGGGTERKIASPRTTDGEAAPEGLDLPSEEELAALAEPAQSKARDLVEQVRLEKLLAKLKEQGKISKAVVAFARPVNPFVPLRKAAPGQLALNWEEAAHPRGAGGRFTTKLGGGVRQSAPGRLQLQWGKPVGLGQLNWAFEAEELEESPLTAKVKKIAGTLPIMEPQALWAFTDEQIAELRREAERNGDEVGMMMVDIHRNVRRDMSPGERADAAAVVKAMLKEYVAGRVSKA